MNRHLPGMRIAGLAVALACLLGALVPSIAFADDSNAPGVSQALPFTISDTLDAATDVRDVSAFDLAAGQTLQVTLTADPGSPFQALLFAPGTIDVITQYAIIGVDAQGATPVTFTFMANQTGTYYLDIYSRGGSGAYTAQASVVPPVAFSLSKISTSKIKRNKWFNAKVGLSPAYNSFGHPVTFYLYYKQGKKWRLKSRGTADATADGVWAVRAKASKGQWRLKASFRDAAHPEQFSAMKSFTVK